MQILLVDDCIETAALVKSVMPELNLVHSENIRQAREILSREKIFLILIDVGLPDGNGFDFCSQLNGELKYRDLIKVMLTAKSDTVEKVYGFSCGADDYITKPFLVPEFKARLKARLKSAYQLSRDQIIYLNPFEFQLGFQKCFISKKQHKEDIGLTPTEFRILFTLVDNQNVPFSRQDLVTKIWKNNGLYIEARGVDSHISHLRKKLGDYSRSIESIYGKGYFWNPSQP